MEDSKKNKKLRYEAELNPLKEFIEASYSESSICVFRNTLSVPPSSIDSIPQSKRFDQNIGEELDLILTDEEVESMTEEEKRSYVSNLAISVFASKEKAERNVKEIVRHIAKNFSLAEAELYLEEKRGPYIVRLQLSPDIGLLEKRFNKKGHANLLLYEGVDIGDSVVEVFPPMCIDNIIENYKLKGSNGSDKR